MAREVIRELADVLPPDLMQDTQLLVSELVLHRVRFRPSRSGTLGLDVCVTEPSVRVQIVDDDRSGDSEPTRTRKPELGWKLDIVAEIADRWGIGGEGLTTVWFELDL